MAFELVKIKDLRNIAKAELNPSTGLNLITGTNGSGKTSIIETIFILGRGRSFRDRRIGSVVKKGEHALELYGTYRSMGNNIRVGVRKGREENELRLNGKILSRLSELVREIPIQIITPKSHEILERGPEYRRRLLDWGVFHVEQQYHQVATRFHRAIAQRNAALRTNPGQASIWDPELEELANRLDSMRSEYASSLQRLFMEEVLYLLKSEPDISLEYRRGWPVDKTLLETFKRDFEGDKRKGFTQHGPHRADLIIKLQGDFASRRASRGQQKLILCALILAQGRVLSEATGDSPVVLVDDLAAELDCTNLRLLVDRLKTNSSQAFITSTEKLPLDDSALGKMFHVEHGMVSD